MFHWSRMPNFIAGHFQVGSIEDAANHRALYNAAIDLTLELFGNRQTSLLITDETIDAWTAMSLTERGCLNPKFHFMPWDQDQQYRGISIQRAFESITRLARLQIDAAKAMPVVFEDSSGREMLSLCRNIVKAEGVLGSPSRVMTKAVPPVKAEQQPGPTEQEPAAFDMVDGDAFKRPFARMDATAEATAESLNPRRMRVLFQEMGVLQTSLPNGIYARVASDRPDMIKVLIVGVEDTPYENGLFEFQILCPPSYPANPPVVSCTTAARAECVRFHLNPNLYSSGYVCLSLIGTWQGHRSESWQPNKSSLLQVLISIQSMILGTETPVNNEPGGLAVPNKQYNYGVQAGTVSGAMLSWLQAKDQRQGIWKDVIEHHFKKNGARILATAKEWSKTNKQLLNHTESASIHAHLAGMDDDMDYASSPEDGQLTAPPPPPVPGQSSFHGTSSFHGLLPHYIGSAHGGHSYGGALSSASKPTLEGLPGLKAHKPGGTYSTPLTGGQSAAKISSGGSCPMASGVKIPLDKPLAPWDKPLALGVKPQAPWDKSQAPWDKPQTPSDRPPWECEKAPWEKAPWEKAPWEKAPWEKAPWEKAPWEKAPWEKASWEKAPWEKAPWDKASGGGPPSGVLPLPIPPPLGLPLSGPPPPGLYHPGWYLPGPPSGGLQSSQFPLLLPAGWHNPSIPAPLQAAPYTASFGGTAYTWAMNHALTHPQTALAHQTTFPFQFAPSAASGSGPPPGANGGPHGGLHGGAPGSAPGAAQGSGQGSAHSAALASPHMPFFPRAPKEPKKVRNLYAELETALKEFL